MTQLSRRLNHGCNLYETRHVSTRAKRYFHMGYLYAQEIECFAIQTRAIGLFLGGILQKGHDEVDPLFKTDETDPEKFLDVNNADPATFHKTTAHVVTKPDRRVIAQQLYSHHIVGNQTVTALDKGKSRLALTRAAIPLIRVPIPRMSRRVPW